MYTVADYTDYRIGFRDVSEEVEVDSLGVEGDLPAWLSGVLVRNGPGRWTLKGDKDLRHWFDGLAMLHRFSFSDGKVSYANRFLRSPQYRRVRETGKIAYPEFATDPCRSIFKRISSAFSPVEFGHNASVTVQKTFEDRFVALTETPLPVEFDPETLDTLGVVSFDDDLQPTGSSPHPHTDPETGDYLNHATAFGGTSSYKLFKVRPGASESSESPELSETLKREVIAEIPARRPAYMHSFGQTLGYAILAEYPLNLNPLKMLLTGRPYAENLEWHPEQPTRFHVIDKRTGRVSFVRDAEPFFCFHHVNAFEREGRLLVDLLAYPDPSIIDDFYLDVLRNPDRRVSGALVGELRRYELDPENEKTAGYEVLSEESLELPRINYEKVAGRPYSVVYGIGHGGEEDREDWTNRLVKTNVEERTTRIWQETDCYPGEPVFVPAPGSEREDEGIVLSVILDAAARGSFLIALDARTFEEVARVRTPQLVPFGFHGAYFGGTRG